MNAKGRRSQKKGGDPNGQHVRIYHDQLNSPAWIALSSSAVRLFVDMRVQLSSWNNGDIELVFSKLKHRGWKSKATLHKAIRELETLGFIALTRQGGIASMSKICSLYRFTDQPCQEKQNKGVAASKATHDYRHFDSVKAAKMTLREAEESRIKALAIAKNKRKLQKLNL